MLPVSRGTAAVTCQRWVERVGTVARPAESPTSRHAAPVVEAPPDGSQPARDDTQLGYRLRQQELLAELGVVALKQNDLTTLLHRAAELAADGLDAELCKVLQYLPDDNSLLVCAGVGWSPGVVGSARIVADLASPSGFAFQTGTPVISNHLEQEERFRTPELLANHGVRRAINVILQGDGAAFGVLEVDSRSTGEFTSHDLTFLQGAANILGMAIERRRYERDLTAAVDHQNVLLKEINHRVKNSLQMVASMLSLQAATLRDSPAGQSLQDAIGRISAVARVHERLYRSASVASVDLAAYLGDLCSDMTSLATKCDIRYAADADVSLVTDRAVHVGLLATELISNAIKHAYPGDSGGVVDVRLVRHGDVSVTLTIRDHGAGLPEALTTNASGGLGMKIVRALVSQCRATLTIVNHAPGTEFVVELPLTDHASPA